MIFWHGKTILNCSSGVVWNGMEWLHRHIPQYFGNPWSTLESRSQYMRWGFELYDLCHSEKISLFINAQNYAEGFIFKSGCRKLHAINCQCFDHVQEWPVKGMFQYQKYFNWVVGNQRHKMYSFVPRAKKNRKSGFHAWFPL